MWITTESSGAYILSNPLKDEKFKFTRFVGRHNLSDRVYNYCLSSDSTIYLVTDVGIRKYKAADTTFTIFRPKGLTSYFNIITMYEDNRRNLWFGTYHGGLYKYDVQKDTVIVYDIRDGLSSNWISSITQDSKGNIWAGTYGGGISVIHTHGIKVYDNNNGLNAKQIFSVMEDVEGNILIGSSNKGLAIFKGELFTSISENEGIKNPEVFAILQDKNNNYWIGSNGGITVLDKTTKHAITSYKEDSYISLKRGLFLSNKIRFLKKDRNDNIWIGTEDRRVIHYNAKDNTFEVAENINKWYTGIDYQVSAMEIDNNNRLWVGTRDGLIMYDIDNDVGERLNNVSGLIGNDISAIYCDNQNQIWVGSYIKEGFSKINENKTITTYNFDNAVTITCMVKDKLGKLWIGTKGQGVMIFDGENIIGKKDVGSGLLSNLINTLNTDNNNNIYIGTNRGLNILIRESGLILTYSKKNGYTGIETNPSASYTDSAGNLWFGTNKGIHIFKTEMLKPDISEPKVHFTRLRVKQDERKIKNDMRLKSNENHISIGYKSICLTNSDAVRYRVMLEGLDDNWNEITTQSSITYQTLPPGKYKFKVIARNSNGVWNSAPAELSFHILPPIYLRWYFIIGVFIVILISMGLYIKIREKNLIREKKILEDKVRERSVELSEANTELATKNKEITDSIRYALNIQLSILPPNIPFKNTFVLFKPKDIVSGDFYWLATVNGKEIMAAIDCTGHGVPGAFMSFIGYSSLNEVVKEKRITTPSKILDNLNSAFVNALNLQGEEAIKDGMDLALVRYDPATHKLEYSGAYNPLYLVRNKELIETRANRFPIGKSTEVEKKFTNHTLSIEKGDMVYILSDGYSDQFGGPDNKKFKTGALKKLLIAIQDESISKQKEILDKTIED